ncbi:hypothetical protein [Nocardioides sp. URHA0020]|uniref:hypothetical protein n=1 Tax=Nocardioides sp. URHA0020 TaxID=1380392 RepID=UPI000685B3A4|nr:hypothetical protein [Nocardioides sp. URHA0020]
MVDVRSAHEGQRVERRREANTMALYIAICLLAALTALPDSKDLHAHGLGIVWGITLGLAVAHWFAFWMATRMVSAGEFDRESLGLAAAQLTGAAAVAVLASIPLLVLPDSIELNATELWLSAFVAVVGYLSMRWGGTSRVKATAYAGAVLLAAVVIVELKNWLAGY